MEDRCVPAHWVVSSPADTVNQPGTLRWAVAQANNGDTIDIQTTRPIGLTHGELYLAHSVTIDFAAFSATSQATVSGDLLSRVFEVAPAAHVNLDNLNVIDGVGVANNPSGTATADGFGGAILNQGTLALTDCTVADSGFTVGTFGSPQTSVIAGGGILNNANPVQFSTPNPVGDLTLTRCQVNDNRAQGGAGGIENVRGRAAVLLSSLSDNTTGGGGGGIRSLGGVLVVAGSDLFNNQAASGGGIASIGRGFYFVLNCQLQFNSAQNDGGGVLNHDGALLTIASTYSDNSAKAGGGIANVGNDVRLGVFSCAFTDNTASAFGGGIFNGPGATATVENSDLIDNSAGAGGGIDNSMSAVLNLGSSLLQTNKPDNVAGSYNDLGGNTFI